MKNDLFDIVKAKKKEIRLDYFLMILTGLAILISIICSSIIKVPEVRSTLQNIILFSGLIFMASSYNVVKYRKSIN